EPSPAPPHCGALQIDTDQTVTIGSRSLHRPRLIAGPSSPGLPASPPPPSRSLHRLRLIAGPSCQSLRDTMRGLGAFTGSASLRATCADAAKPRRRRLGAFTGSASLRVVRL